MQNQQHKHPVQKSPGFFLSVFFPLVVLIIGTCTPALILAKNHSGKNEGHALLLRYEAETGRSIRLSSGPQLNHRRQYSADLYWQSGSGTEPVMVLCGNELRIEQDEPVALTLTRYNEQSESGEACYQLQLFQPGGHALLHGITSYQETGNPVDTSGMVADWQFFFNFLAAPEKPEKLSVNDFSAGQQVTTDNHTIPWLPNDLPRLRNHVLIPGGADSGDSPDNPRRPGRPFFYTQDTLLVLPVAGKALVDWLTLLASDFWRLAFAARHPSDSSAQDPVGYVIHIYTCDGNQARFITRDEWQEMIRQNGLSAEGILTLLNQKDSDGQQSMEQLEALFSLPDPLYSREESPVASSDINKLLVRLSPPVKVEVSTCSSFQVPGVLQLGGGGKGKQTGAAPPAKREKKTGKSGTSGTLAGEGSSGTGEASGGEQPPVDDLSAGPGQGSSEKDLCLVQILQSFPGFLSLTHRNLLMALYGMGFLSFEEAAGHRKPMEKMKQLAADITGTEKKVQFLQLIYLHLAHTVRHNFWIKSFMDSIPEPYHKAVQKHISLESSPSQDEESALETLRRTTAAALYGFSYSHTLAQVFTTDETRSDIARALMYCHSMGAEGYRKLYRETDFRQFYGTHLSPVFLGWLQGSPPPWREPELTMINSAEQAMAMKGLSRLDSWGAFLLEAYGNSALTFHQFQGLVELPDEQRYEAFKRVAASLDIRRAARFLWTLNQVLKKQHPVLSEQLIRQAGEEVRSNLTASIEMLPLPEETGEGDHWRRAFAVALKHYTGREALDILSLSCMSEAILELGSGPEYGLPNSENKLLLVIRLSSDKAEKDTVFSGGLEQALERNNIQGARTYAHMMEIFASSRPALLGKHTRVQEDMTTEEESDPDIICAVCLEDMTNCPTVLCTNCENGVCLKCGKTLCKKSYGACPTCREKGLLIPRQLRD